MNTFGKVNSKVFFTLLILELEIVSEELVEARDFFGQGCKHSIVTSYDECGRRVSLSIPLVSHLLPTDQVVFEEGDVAEMVRVLALEKHFLLD